MVENPEVIINALKTGYRHLDLAENNSNSSMIKTALKKAFRFVQDGGLGLSRELTMKVAKLNNTTDNVDNLLNAVVTGYPLEIRKKFTHMKYCLIFLLKINEFEQTKLI